MKLSQHGIRRRLILIRGSAPCPAWIYRDRFAIPPGRATVEQLRVAVLRRFQQNVADLDREVVTAVIRLEWVRSELPEFRVEDDRGEITVDHAIDLFATSIEDAFRHWLKQQKAQSNKR